MYVGLNVSTGYSSGHSCQSFNETWIFWTVFFSKNTQISNFTKTRPVRAKFFHTDGRTDMTKLKVGFRNFASAPKNSMLCPNTAVMCLVWLSTRTALISLYRINWLAFIIETQDVYCAVSTECSTVTQLYVSLRRIKRYGLKNIYSK